MTNHTARMAALLGELRREMNGAVAESMQRGEGGYGLNYGVSIPTIRAIAGRVGTDHAFARGIPPTGRMSANCGWLR